MELRVLRYFLMVAKEQSFTKAAEQLNITQPTLSRQLAALEDELGAKLFNRGGHSITLTNEGLLLKRQALEIVDLEEKIISEFKGNTESVEGKINLDGQDITGKSTIDINKAGIARTFQNIRLFHQMSVLDNVKAGLHNHDKYSLFTSIVHTPKYFKVEKTMNEEAMKLLKVFDLDKEADILASNLPYGKQRKLEIARALATKPKLLLLDEPAAGMNPNETEELMDTIRFVRDNFDMTILLIEHDMKLVSGICEELTVLNFGHVLRQGKTSDVLHDPEVIKAYLGE